MNKLLIITCVDRIWLQKIEQFNKLENESENSIIH